MIRCGDTYNLNFTIPHNLVMISNIITAKAFGYLAGPLLVLVADAEQTATVVIVVHQSVILAPNPNPDDRRTDSFLCHRSLRLRKVIMSFEVCIPSQSTSLKFTGRPSETDFLIATRTAVFMSPSYPVTDGDFP